jgi:hypothetical protein
MMMMTLRAAVALVAQAHCSAVGLPGCELANADRSSHATGVHVLLAVAFPQAISLISVLLLLFGDYCY